MKIKIKYLFLITLQLKCSIKPSDFFSFQKDSKDDYSLNINKFRMLSFYGIMGYGSNLLFWKRNIFKRIRRLDYNNQAKLLTLLFESSLFIAVGKTLFEGVFLSLKANTNKELIEINEKIIPGFSWLIN